MKPIKYTVYQYRHPDDWSTLVSMSVPQILGLLLFAPMPALWIGFSWRSWVWSDPSGGLGLTLIILCLGLVQLVAAWAVLEAPFTYLKARFADHNTNHQVRTFGWSNLFTTILLISGCVLPATGLWWNLSMQWQFDDAVAAYQNASGPDKYQDVSQALAATDVFGNELHRVYTVGPLRQTLDKAFTFMDLESAEAIFQDAKARNMWPVIQDDWKLYYLQAHYRDDNWGAIRLLVPDRRGDKLMHVSFYHWLTEDWGDPPNCEAWTRDENINQVIWLLAWHAGDHHDKLFTEFLACFAEAERTVLTDAIAEADDPDISSEADVLWALIDQQRGALPWFMKDAREAPWLNAPTIPDRTL